MATVSRIHRSVRVPLGALALLALSGSILSAADGFEPPVDREFIAELDGSTQRYVELRPGGFDPQGEVEVVIALHGHGADRWQYVREQRGECRGVRDVAGRHGMLFISPDYRAKTSWMGPAAEADIVQLIAILRDAYRVRRLYLAGASMGGTSVLIFAALHPDLVDGVVSQNGTANMVEYGQFQDAISASYGGARADVPDEYRKRSPELIPDKLTMPLALMVGGQDTIVPPDSVRRLARKLADLGRRHVRLIDDEQGGHSSGYDETVDAFEFVIHSAHADADPPQQSADHSR